MLPPTSALSVDAILRPTSWCVVREQEERSLVYNPRTDELHLIPPAGIYAFRLCDGLNTVGEIATLMTRVVVGSAPAAQSAVLRFLADLVARDILEIDEQSQC